MREKVSQIAVDTSRGRAADSRGLRIRGLHKAFGEVRAVEGIDLEVKPGECFGLLGPNGAGKTTTIEICEGLTTPDAGTVELLGRNWQQDANELRQLIGIQLQETQFPEKLTVEEVLRLFRSFYRRGMTLDEAIALAQLEEKRRARVGGLSGGQKQRLAMATALVGDPELLFLDEPTTGLDPTSRVRMWDIIRQLVTSGVTLLLTTQYLDEADELADQIVVVDHGRVIADGTPADLKAKVGGARLEVTLNAPNDEAAIALRPLTDGDVHVSHDGRRLRAPVRSGVGLATSVVRTLDQAGITVDDVEVHQPSLDDVFFALTGHPSSETDEIEDVSSDHVQEVAR